MAAGRSQRVLSRKPCGSSQGSHANLATIFPRRVSTSRCGLRARRGRVAQVAVANYEYDVDNDTMRERNVPAMPPARIPPPPNRPPPRVPRAMPPNNRRIVFAAAALIGALLLQQATKDWATPNRRVLLTRDSISEMEMGFNDRVPGDMFLYNQRGQVYYAGVDGIRVDTNGDVWAEVTDDKGEVTDLTFISNVQDIKDQ